MVSPVHHYATRKVCRRPRRSRVQVRKQHSRRSREQYCDGGEPQEGDGDSDSEHK